MDNTDNLKTRIVDVITENFDVDIDDIKDDSRIEDLNLDSLERVELILELENEFNISISDEEANDFKTIEDIISFVKANSN